MTTPTQIQTMISQQALFVVNHSGGKDSQAMMIKLLEIVPASQMLVVHASLGEVEWEGALEVAQKQATDAGVPFIVATPVKGFIEMVEHRFATRPQVPSFPSASTRQCTSDLKRGPIEREIRRYAAAKGITQIVSCSGIRAAESVARSKQSPLTQNTKQSIAGRTWMNWCPIFTLSTDDVFATIAAAGQEPHWAYAAGNQRLSCLFCIMGSASDLKNAAKHAPNMYEKFVALEEKTGYTMHMSRKSLLQIVGIPVRVEVKAAA